MMMMMMVMINITYNIYINLFYLQNLRRKTLHSESIVPHITYNLNDSLNIGFYTMFITEKNLDFIRGCRRKIGD